MHQDDAVSPSPDTRDEVRENGYTLRLDQNSSRGRSSHE